MRTLIKVLFLGSVCLVGWWVGGQLSSDALGMALGCIFGVMVGIPMALIAMTTQKRVQHHHFHHIRQVAQIQTETPSQPTLLSVRPTRYIVVNEPVKRIEVKR